MPVARAHLRDLASGDAHIYEMHWSYGRESLHYMWFDGNYACDCNRSIFLWDDENRELPCCSEKANRIVLDRLELDGKEVKSDDW